MSSKVCLSCAGIGKLKFLPCPQHHPAIDPADCEHEITSYTITHNGEADGYLCHACGTITQKEEAIA